MPDIPSPQRLIRFEDFQLNLRSGELRQNGGKTVRLPEQPFRILLLLLQHPQEVVTREELRKALWANDTVVEFEHSISVAINRLRQSLGDSADNPHYIETLARRGYRWMLPATQDLLTDESASSDSHQSVRVERQKDGHLPALAKPAKFGLWKSVSGGTALVILFGIVWFAVSHRVPQVSRDSIAVMPLVNTADPQFDYLSDGITEGIIRTLSHMPKLHVIARTTVFRYKGRQFNPRQVGRDLHVRVVLTGTFAKRDDSIRVQAALVDVDSGSEIWREEYERKSSDISDIQQAVVHDVSPKLGLHLTNEDSNKLHRSSSRNGEAYDLYLKGRFFLNQRTPSDFRAAVQTFDAVTTKDSSFALAWSGLADAYNLTSGYGGLLPPKQAHPKARAAALRAIELDSSLAEAHASLGLCNELDWDWEGAEQQYAKAIELNPNYAPAHQWYSMLLFLLMKKEQALAEANRAIDIDPLSLPVQNNLADLYVAENRFDDAVRQYQKVLAIDPRDPDAHNGLAGVYFAQRRYSEAFREWKQYAVNTGDPDAVNRWNAVELKFLSSGNRAAMQMAARLQIQAALYISPTMIATTYFAAADPDQGFAWLERAYHERDDTLEIIVIDPSLAPFRTDKRYLDVLRRMGLLR